MSDTHAPKTESTFVCDCQPWMRVACGNEPRYKSYKGKNYCVLHYPGAEKSAVFETALQRRREATNSKFCGVWFPDVVSFSGITFDADVDFRNATFNASVSFQRTTFRGMANFRHTTFNGKVYFGHAIFMGAADFRAAIFGDYVEFQGNPNKPMFSQASSLSLQFARVGGVDRFLFRSVVLRPHW